LPTAANGAATALASRLRACVRIQHALSRALAFSTPSCLPHYLPPPTPSLPCAHTRQAIHSCTYTLTRAQTPTYTCSTSTSQCTRTRTRTETQRGLSRCARSPHSTRTDGKRNRMKGNHLAFARRRRQRRRLQRQRQRRARVQGRRHVRRPGLLAVCLLAVRRILSRQLARDIDTHGQTAEIARGGQGQKHPTLNAREKARRDPAQRTGESEKRASSTHGRKREESPLKRL